LNRILALVIQHEAFLQEQWDAYFAGRN
jgi:hypothetical protein